MYARSWSRTGTCGSATSASLVTSANATVGTPRDGASCPSSISTTSLGRYSPSAPSSAPARPFVVTTAATAQSAATVAARRTGCFGSSGT